MRGKPLVEVRLRVSTFCVTHLEEVRKALSPDDYKGAGVEISSLLQAGELVYVISSSYEHIYRIKSVVNEILRLLRMLGEASNLLKSAG
ncbi:MAG: hypothetical protein QXI90_03410, partial [Thermofilum sp.]